MDNPTANAQSAATEIHPRKKQIVDKALELFVTHGYDSTSVEDIAQACNMSKGNFYHYFDSKEELIYLIQAETVHELTDEVASLDKKILDIGLLPTLQYFVRQYLHSIDRHQDAYNFLNHVVIQLESGGRRVLLRRSVEVQELFERLIQAGISQGVFRPVNAKLVAHNIVRLASSWANNRWHLRKFITLEEYCAEQMQYLIYGIGVAK